MSSCCTTSPDLAPQGAVGGIHEADDMVVARIAAGFGGEFFGGHMVGYEYEYRAAEPFFASEALEEEPEGIVDIGYALVRFV